MRVNVSFFAAAEAYPCAKYFSVDHKLFALITITRMSIYSLCKCVVIWRQPSVYCQFHLFLWKNLCVFLFGCCSRFHEDVYNSMRSIIFNWFFWYLSTSCAETFKMNLQHCVNKRSACIRFRCSERARVFKWKLVANWICWCARAIP